MQLLHTELYILLQGNALNYSRGSDKLKPVSVGGEYGYDCHKHFAIKCMEPHPRLVHKGIIL